MCVDFSKPKGNLRTISVYHLGTLAAKIITHPTSGFQVLKVNRLGYPESEFQHVRFFYELSEAKEFAKKMVRGLV